MKLRKAIKTIKKECKKHDMCAMCPLRTENNYYCVVQRITPKNYTLKSKKALDKDDSNQRIFA